MEYLRIPLLVQLLSLSLINIMDDEDAHTIPPSHIHIDPNQLEMIQNLFQMWMIEMSSLAVVSY